MAMQVQIPRKVYEKIMHWINKSDKEVGGFGRVTWHPTTGVFWVEDAHLVEQEVSGATVDLDPNGVNRLAFKTRGQPGELKWWWHSHVAMSVFWSSTDKDTIKELGKHDWCAATVFNQRREFRSAVGVKREVTQGYKDFFTNQEPQPTTSVEIIDELATFVMDEDTDIAAWDEEFKRCVKERSYSSPKTDPEVVTANTTGGKTESWRKDPVTGHLTYLGTHREEASRTTRDELARHTATRGSGKAGDGGKSSGTKSFTQLNLLAATPTGLDELPLAEDGGLLGYGLIVEATALKMRPSQLRTILDTRNAGLIADYEDKLTALERAGEFNGIPTFPLTSAVRPN